MTGQTLNGTKRPHVPTWEPFTPIHIGGIGEPEVAPEPEAAPAEPAIDLVAAAEAQAIRTRAEAEAEAARIAAQAEADAVRAKAEVDAKRQAIANEKAEMALAEKRAEHENKLADLAKRRQETERETALARAAAEEGAAVAQAEQAKRGKSAGSWKRAAISFAIVCAVVALPVQMSAFWDRSAPWLVGVPIVLEAGAWVVLKGAAAAVDDHRPHWHYRLIAWALAFLASGINLTHGLAHFGLATALATAFASVAGPGIWDLHEHGRIRLRDGVKTRRERKAQRREEKRAAAEQRAEQARRDAERKAIEDAQGEAARQLAAEREKTYPEEWTHAIALRAALGETTVTEAVWRRAWRDIHGTDPGDTVDTIRTRRTAERRIEMARGEAPSVTPSKVVNAQRANQMPRAQRGPARKPPARRRGDTAPYVQAARNAAAITARNAAKTATQKDA